MRHSDDEPSELELWLRYYERRDALREQQEEERRSDGGDELDP